MSKHYQIERSQDSRKKRYVVVVAVFILLVLVGGSIYVVADLNRNRLSIDNTENAATLGVVNPIKEPDQLFQTDLYQFKAPADWRRINNPEVTVGNKRYYPDRYQGTTGNHIGRKVDVYIDSIPSDLGIDKVIAVQPAGQRVIVGGMSEQCYYFTDVPDGKSGNNFPSFWEEEGIKFLCKSSVITNVVGAIYETQSTGVTLKTSVGDKNFFLVYTDHGSSTNNNIFIDILASFRTK